MSFTGKPAATSLITVTNDGFWLDLELGEFLTSYRIPAEYADDTIAYGVKLAILSVNTDLVAVKNLLIANGYNTFAATFSLAFIPNTTMWDELGSIWDSAGLPDISEAKIGGEAELSIVYKKAVFSHAKAYLLEQFNSMNRRKDAENAAKEAPETQEFWLNQSQQAIYLLVKRFLPDANVTANHGVYVALI